MPSLLLQLPKSWQTTSHAFAHTYRFAMATVTSASIRNETQKSLKSASERRSLAASSSSCFFVFCRRRETTLRRTSTTTSADHRRHRGLSARAFRETSRRPASKTWRRRILKMLKRWLKLNSWFVLVLFCEDVSKSSVGCSKSWKRKVVHAKKVCAVSCGQQNHNEELN